MTEQGNPHLEIERKYEANSSLAMPEPELPGISVADPETHQLRATYYDTATGHLGRAGMALRRRLGGTDAGWHLKHRTPAGVDERHWPDAETAPAAALTEIADTLDGHPLLPIATIDTTRVTHTLRDDDGGPVIEIADDTVTATNNRDNSVRRWREWEAELLTEDHAYGGLLLDRLEPQLIAAGASVSPSAAKIQRALGLAVPAAWKNTGVAGVLAAHLTEYADRLSGAEAAVRADAPDAVHAARTTVRRARALLSEYAPLLPKAATARAHAALRELGANLGVPRDTEVRLEHAARWHVSGEDNERLTAGLSSEHAQAHATLITRLNDGNLDDALSALRQLSEKLSRRESAGRTEPAEAALTPLLRAAEHRLEQRTHRLATGWADTSEAILGWASAPAGSPEPAAVAHAHRVRKHARRFRYAAEVLAVGAESPAPRAAAGRAKTLQSQLGELRDVALFSQRVRQIDAPDALTHRLAAALLTGLDSAGSELARRETA